MRHAAKSYEQVGGKGRRAKVSYTRWLYAKVMLQKLRDKGHSVTEVSRMVKGHGDTPNWSAGALDYREQVNERDIRQLEELTGVPKVPTKRGKPFNAKYLKGPNRHKFSECLSTLREKFGWTNQLIGDALGMTASNVGVCIRQGGGTQAQLNRARNVVAKIRALSEGDDTPPDFDTPPIRGRDVHIKSSGASKRPPAQANGIMDMTGVQEALMGIAARVEELGNTVPKAFRQPWTDKANEILAMAEGLSN